MLEDKLEIPIITYNRAAFLERTLEQLRDSPFARCKITVLDNCSTDETAAVCAKFQPLFSNLHVIRHRVNIGLSANYLRAVEISRATYTWLLCDDDLYDFSDCGDVIEAIETERVDLISLGSPAQFEWERGVTATTQELVARGVHYLAVFTFASGVIFRTVLFDSECMVKGYRNAVYSFPHTFFLERTVRENRLVYNSKRWIVKRDPHGIWSSTLHFWVTCSGSVRMVEDRKLREAAIYQLEATRKAWVVRLARAIIEGKLWEPQKVSSQVTELALSFTPGQRLWLLSLSPLVLIPAGIFRFGRWLRRAAGSKRVTDRNYPKEDLFRV